MEVEVEVEAEAEAGRCKWDWFGLGMWSCFLEMNGLMDFRMVRYGEDWDF